MTDVPHDVWPGGLPAVGQVAERSRKVHSSDIERFTDISGDRNPLHYNEAVARRTRFGEIVVRRRYDCLLHVAHWSTMILASYFMPIFDHSFSVIRCSM